MPRPRKNAVRDDLDLESDDDLYAEPDVFLEGLRFAVARARSSGGETFDLSADSRHVDLDGLGAAEYGE